MIVRVRRNVLGKKIHDLVIEIEAAFVDRKTTAVAVTLFVSEWVMCTRSAA